MVQGFRCFSLAYSQAERQIDNKKWLKPWELDEIKAKCEDECCDPSAYECCEDGLHWYEVHKLEYERERLAKQDNHEERRRVPFDNYYEPEIEWTASSSSSATSSTIPKAATEHSLIGRLLAIANENPRSGEAATEHSEIPEVACQKAKRLKKEEKKSGKGTSSHARTKSPDPKDVAG